MLYLRLNNMQDIFFIKSNIELHIQIKTPYTFEKQINIST